MKNTYKILAFFFYCSTMSFGITKKMYNKMMDEWKMGFSMVGGFS
jgi:hypothetical protein